ncbi:NXPE family member 1 [Patella vulgata]|uniref:NXPE family member 1 n=1 Tax=Patella vulgata TaxID=6465 RepID=UPI0024A8DA09|nr:NXPE family member 1 [Patella vulgata]
MEVDIFEDILPPTTIKQPKPKPTLHPKSKPKPPTIYLSLKPMHCVVHGMRQQCVGPFHKNLIGVNQCQTPLCVCFPQELVLIPPKPMEDPNFPPKNEMLPVEQEMLHDEEFVDILTAANLNHSTLTLLNPKTQYNVGDVITVRINMVDGYGKQRVVGGDDVRVRMKGINNVHLASGNVMDLNNGSYTVTLKALWSGKVTIEATLPYTREAIATMFKWRRQYRTLFYYYGHFVKGTLSEYTMCSPYPTIQGYPSICNLTSMNYNYPWFCGQPINPLLSCDDFKLANDFDYTQIPVTPAQFITFDR